MHLARRISLLAALAAVCTQPALSQKFTGTPFSADMKINARQQAGMTSGKMYAAAEKWRMDMSMNGREAIMIFDASSNMGYMLMPEQKMYMEMRADAPAPHGGPRAPRAKPMDPNNPCAGDANMTCQKTGTEVVNGRTTDRWDFTSKDKGENYTAWVDQKLHFPIKTQNSQGEGMELTNIQEGAPPASVFEIPSGYKKFDMGGMMQGIPR
jgi:hypothetical protein